MKASKIIKALVGIGTVVGSIGGIFYVAQKSMKEEKKLSGRYRSYYELANQWITNKNRNLAANKFLEDNNYKKIAIYGMGTLADLLYEEIKNTGIEVAYFVDKNADEIYYGKDDVPVIGIDEIANQEEVDVMIVTPVFDFDQIVTDLEEEGVDVNIISLEEIIYEV